MTIYFRPLAFETFFVFVNEVHDYNTRLSSKISYSIPRIRTNYGKFNTRFQGIRVWNSIYENIKSLSPLPFKTKLKIYFIDKYHLIFCSLLGVFSYT